MRCVCLRRTGSSPVSRTSSVTLHPIRDHHICGGRELFCPRWHSIYFVAQTHVAVSPCGSPRFSFLKSRLRRSDSRSSPQKVTLRLRCSLINALTTLRLAINFLRIRARAFLCFVSSYRACLYLHPNPKIGRHRKVPAVFYFFPLHSSLFPFHCTGGAGLCPPPAPSRAQTKEVFVPSQAREGDINL